MTGCSDCFGCIGLRRRQHCVLNKQYSKKEYAELLPRILAHMRQSGEWGEFFPIAFSISPYNLSKGSEWYPLTKAEALERGYAWHDAEAREFMPQSYELPDRIEDAGDDVTRAVLSCAGCGRNYRIVPAELKFYRKMSLALPRRCFHCRHAERMMQRNPRMLWDRECSACRAPFRTSYAPARPEQVYCERCYLHSLG